MTDNYTVKENPLMPARTTSSVKILTGKILLLLVIAISFLNQAVSQSITNYNFQASTGTFVPLSGGTSVPAILADDATSGPIPIGFYFYYMGVPYNQVYANSNGYITFTSTPTTSGFDMRSNNLAATAADHPILAAFWDDLMGNNSTGTPSAKYQTTGSPGSRVFTMEFLNWAIYSGSAVAPMMSFQIQLEEATGIVRYVYRSESGTASFTATIGISKSPTMYASLSGSTGTATVSNSTSSNSITTKPASGQTFEFVPAQPVPASPVNISFTAVTATSMTVNWVDNSTNETQFAVFRSTDNVNFTYVGSVASTSSATTGNTYSLPSPGLSSTTTYYYKIEAVSESPASTPLTGSQATAPGTICGTKIVGPSAGADYPSITAAIADIAANFLGCSTVIELQPAYVSSVETFPITIPNLSIPVGQTLTIRPQTGATGLLITSAAASVFVFDGASKVIIDGRPGSVGTSRELTIQNTATTGVSVRFLNGANNNTVTYTRINGVTTSTTSGVVLFSTSTAASGNSSNTISNSAIYDGATTPTHLIYSSGTTGKPNTGNVISGNELYNFFNPSSTSTGVNLQDNNTGWTITGNHIYQTASRSATSGNTHSAILINSSVGSGFTITNNFIGGSTTNAGGSPWAYTATIATRFMGINATSVSTSGTSTIDGNTIANIALTSSSGTTTAPGILAGISVSTGNWNIGTVTPNVIGSMTGTGSITVTATTAGTNIYGINSSSSGNVTIANNQVGGYTLNTVTSNTVRSSFFGINAGSGTVIITGNTVGGAVANSINNMSGNTSTTSGLSTVGITFAGTTGTITNNTIQNLAYTAAGTRAEVRGINITSGAVTTDNNSIFTLSNSSDNTSTGSTSAIIGLSMTSTTAGAIISDTDINGLNSSSPTAAVSVIGIYYSGPTSGTNIISRNQVRGISVVSSSATSVITGIHVAGGASTYRNNIVNLGLDASGTSLTGAYTINGILKATTSNNNFFYNTIRIQGTGVGAGTSNTYAFIRTSTGTDEFINNIVSNIRTNASTGGIHYGISLNAATSFNGVKNNYWVTGSQLGRVGTTDYANMVAWKAGANTDFNSLAVDPNFVSALDSHISTTVPTPLESGASAISGITNDYDGDVRPGPVGSVNGGGTAPDIGADEFDGIPVPTDVGAVALVTPSATGCYTASETVTVQIKNLGGQTLDMTVDPVTVSASVTGPNPVTFTPVVISTGSIPANGTQNVVISTNYDMSAAGTYVFSASASTPNDVTTGNNNMTPVTISIAAGTATASATDLCGGESVTLSLTGNQGAIQWQSSTDGISWVNETGTGSTTATYTATPADTIMYRALICGLHASNVLTINVNTVTSPTANNVTSCGGGAINLTATGTGNILWYTSPTSTTVVATGTSLTVNTTVDTTLYVSASNGMLYNVGMVNNSAGGSQSSITNYNIFSVFASGVKLRGVYVYPGAAGNVVLELLNSAGTLLKTATVPVTSANINQKTWIPLNWDLPVANDLRLARGAASVSLFRNDAGATFPYTVPGVLSITGAAVSGYYYYAYDWLISTGCESARVPVSIDVTPATPITVTPSSATICSGATATLSVSSANSGYTYSWSPATGLNTTSGNTVIASPTNNTVYTVSAVDGSGCQTTATASVTVNMSPSITASATPAAICPGGSSQLDLAHNTPLIITVGTGTVTNSATSYPAPYGNYYYGARHQFLVRASELYALGLTAGPIGKLGFDVSNTNGADPLTNFEIKMGLTTANSVAAFTSGLTTVYNSSSYAPVTGWNMHTFSSPFIWDGVSNIIIETCFNNTGYTDNASVRQTATSYASSVYYRADLSGVCSNTTVSGTSNQRPNIRLERAETVTYAWSPSASLSDATITNPVATPATTTTYTVVVSTSNGCTDTATTTVTVNPISVSVSSTTDVLCNGDATGTATAAAAGGNTISYQWNTVPPQTTPTATGLTAGTYTVIATNETGCSDTATAVITEPSAISVSLMASNVSCFGGNDGSVTAVVSGGVPTYSYMWSPSGGTASMATGLTAGTYTLSVTDANGCLETASTVVNDGAVVTVAITGNDTICSGSSTTLTASGATSYQWSTTETTAAISVTPTTTSTYTVTGTDGNGCTGTASVEVTVETAPVASFTYTSTGMDFNFTGSGANTLNWDFGDMTTGTGASVAHTYQTAGSYTVTLTASNSCGSNTEVQTIVVSGLATAMTSGVNIYPNPSKGVYNLEMSGKTAERITVLDVDGRIVLDEAVTPASVVRTTVDLSKFAKGVYTLRVSGENIENFRLILN